MEYLEKVSLSGGINLFTKQSSENKKRIKSFHRICFLIYAGKKDQYMHKLHTLMNKISDVIKNPETQHPNLLILILFCIRILILRLSSVTLNNLFRNIWPMLLTLLL